MSDPALLAGFLMLWLKHYVISIAPQEALSVGVVYPVVLLAYGCPFTLLLAMVCSILSWLSVLTDKFCKVKKVLYMDGTTRT